MDENQGTPVVETNGGSELVRKVVAALVGIVIVVAVVLLAKWLGDRIRERFVSPKIATTNTSNAGTTTPNTVAQNNTIAANSNMQTSGQTNNGTVVVNRNLAQTPATGPEDIFYVISGGMALVGVSSKFFANKFKAS